MPFAVEVHSLASLKQHDSRADASARRARNQTYLFAQAGSSRVCGRRRLLQEDCRDQQHGERSDVHACFTSDYSSEAPPEEIRHLDEEGAPVAAEARLKQPADGVEAVAVHVVVVTYIKGCAGVGRPSEKKLRACARL